MPASGSPTIAESCRARRGSGVRSKQWPTNSPAVAKPMAGRHEWLRMKAAESGNWKTERTNREIGRPGNRADKSRNLETGKLGNRKMDPRADGQAPKPDPPGCPGSVVPYYSLRAPRKQRRVVAGRVEAGRTPPGSARSAGSGQAPPATGFLPSPAKPSFAFWAPVKCRCCSSRHPRGFAFIRGLIESFQRMPAWNRSWAAPIFLLQPPGTPPHLARLGSYRSAGIATSGCSLAW